MSSTVGGNAIAAVPCEGTDELVLLDIATGDSLGLIPVGSDPVHATTCAGTTFVATMGERAVSAVTPDGTVERIETGVLGPSHFAQIDGELFVSCTAGDTLAVIDSVELRLVDRVPVGAEPHEMAVSPSGDVLYVGSRRDGTVDAVRPSERAVVSSVRIAPRARVQGVALDPDGERGYAVDQRGARVVAFEANPSGLATGVSASVGGDPYDLVVTDRRVFVPGRAAGTVHEFDLDLDPVTVHDGFSRPVDLFRLDGSWWVLDADDAAIRSLDGRSVATVAPGLSATTVDAHLLVSHYDADLVSLVHPRDGVVWCSDVPAYPFGAVVI